MIKPLLLLLMSFVLELQYISCLQKSKVYCVAARTNSSCHTLRYYMTNSSLYFKNDTTFIFLPGNHYTDTSISLEVSNVSGLTLEGQNAVIDCKQQKNYFYFQHIQNLVIRGISFFSCGTWPIDKGSGYSTLSIVHVLNLKLANIVIWKSEYQGILIDRSTGSIFVDDSAICDCQTKNDNGRPVNAIYFTNDNCLNTSLVMRNVHLLNNTVSDNQQSTTLDYPFAAGLTVVIKCPNISMYFDNITADGNSGGDGGNFAFIFHTPNLYRVPPVIVNNSKFLNGIAIEGGGIFASLVEPVSSTNLPKQNASGMNSHTILHVENTAMINNSAFNLGGAIAIRQKESDTISYIGDIIIKNCSFLSNSLKKGGNGGTAITSINFIFTEVQGHITPQFTTLIIDCFFRNNFVHKNHRKSSGTAVIFVKTNPYFRLQNITIKSNNSSAILGLQSNLVLGGTISIANNNAESGGGILLCQNAILYLERFLDLKIHNNSAKHTGGGIAVESLCMVSKPICFFQLAESAFQDYSNISISIHNNKAKHAGANLYGGSVDYCYMIESPVHNVQANKSLLVFNKIFDIYPNGSGKPYVTSPPDHVCICENETVNCNISDYYCPTSIYPGKSFAISIILAGQLDGTVPGLVQAELEHKNPNILLSKGPKFTKLKASCNALSLKINANVTKINATMAIRAAQQGDISVTEYLPQYRPLKVIITISECPKGFTISLDEMSCTCEQTFVRAASGCYIENQTIVVLKNAWIGYVTNNSDLSISLGSYISTDHCPAEYCNPGQSSVVTTLTEFKRDSQCLANRQGIMCGECTPGYSVMFGGTSCAKCTNKWLSLIFVYALAGIILVFGLTFLDITVADGTVNGLIFYANIVQANYHTLFIHTERNQWITTILTMFIGWISFGNGTEKCFYDGMTEYHKAWIQFAFPFYIWLLLGLIVLLSRRYIVVTRIVGTNAVKVLATLILLSYSKFLLAIIASIDSTAVFVSGGGYRLVWTKNGNIPFIGKKHLPLLIFSLCLLIVLIPFTVTLVFIQFLERFSHYTLLYLVRKMKPLLDAYTGPYTDIARFWTGFMLLVRIIIFIMSTLTGRLHFVANISITTALLFVVLTTAFFLHNGIYKQKAVQMLEGSLYINLALLFVAADYAHIQNIKPTPFSQVFVGIAFVTFITVIVYHIAKKVYPLNAVQKCVSAVKHRIAKRAQYERILSSGDLMAEERRYLPPIVQFTEDREPLLAN